MATAQEPAALFLQDVENNPQPSPYFDLIAAAKSSGTEYWHIWNLLAFRPKAAYHLVASRRKSCMKMRPSVLRCAS